MGLTSFLFRSMNTSEQKMFDEVVAPLEDTLIIKDDNIPAYIEAKPTICWAQILIAEYHKAYHIHDWFVVNIMPYEDEDPSREYVVRRADMENLLATLEAVNKDNAKELLPTDYEYDEDYWDQIKCVKELSRYLLDNFDWDGCALFYSSSW